jgi:2,5-furandicarboxylate decarboxylase 1
MPVIECKKVTRRSDGIFRTIVGGSLEHVMLNNVAREANVYQLLKRAVPGVLDVHLPAFGCGFIAFLSVKADYVSEAKNALLIALSAHPVVKYAIVVDEDVNVRDERQVFWAVATRSGGDLDLVFAPRTYNHVMDPGSDNGFVHKLGIDATFPPEKRERYKRVKYE